MVLVIAALVLAGLLVMRIVRRLVRWVLGAAFLGAALLVLLAWPRPTPAAVPAVPTARLLSSLNQGYATAMQAAVAGDTKRLTAQAQALSSQLVALQAAGSGASAGLQAYARHYRTFLAHVNLLVKDALTGNTAGESRVLAIVTQEGQALSLEYQALVLNQLSGQ